MNLVRKTSGKVTSVPGLCNTLYSITFKAAMGQHGHGLVEARTFEALAHTIQQGRVSVLQHGQVSNTGKSNYFLFTCLANCCHSFFSQHTWVCCSYPGSYGEKGFLPIYKTRHAAFSPF